MLPKSKSDAFTSAILVKFATTLSVNCTASFWNRATSAAEDVETNAAAMAKVSALTTVP